MNSEEANLMKEKVDEAQELDAQDPEFGKDSDTIKLPQESMDNVIALPKPRKVSRRYEKLFTTAREAQKACEDNPGDPNNWKKWGMSLVYTRGLLKGEKLPLQLLYAAKKELKKAAKKDRNDLEAMWSLGEIYMYILSTDSSIPLENHGLYRKYCTNAVDWFKRVRVRDPKFCIGATGFTKAQQELDFVSSLR